MGCPNARLCALFAKFSLKDTQTTLLKPRFSSMFSWKSKFQWWICIFAPKVCLKLAPTKVSPNLAQKFESDNVCQKLTNACDAPATPCDLLRRFLRRLRRFLRRLVTFSATPCDVFWRVFGRLCHFWPHPWKIWGNVPKFQVSCLVSPRFDENLDKEKEVYGKDCVAARFGSINLIEFDDVFVLFHDPIANLHQFSFQNAPLAAILAKFGQHVKANVFYPGLLYLSQWLPCRGKEWRSGGVYMLDELPKVGSFKSLQNPDTFSEEPMLRAFWFKLRIQQKKDNPQYLALIEYILKIFRILNFYHQNMLKHCNFPLHIGDHLQYFGRPVL